MTRAESRICGGLVRRSRRHGQSGNHSGTVELTLEGVKSSKCLATDNQTQNPLD